MKTSMKSFMAVAVLSSLSACTDGGGPTTVGQTSADPVRTALRPACIALRGSCNDFGNDGDCAFEGQRIYDDQGRLVRKAEASGKAWQYRYDDLGNLIQKTDVDGGVWRYIWRAQALISVTDSSGVRTSCAKDPMEG